MFILSNYERLMPAVRDDKMDVLEGNYILSTQKERLEVTELGEQSFKLQKSLKNLMKLTKGCKIIKGLSYKNVFLLHNNNNDT